MQVSSKSILALISSSIDDFFSPLFLELFSIDGAIRVISDDFSISLLNPESELYKYKADKYENMVSRDSCSNLCQYNQGYAL